MSESAVRRGALLATKPFLNINETARYLGVSRWTIVRALRASQLPFIRMGRMRLIPRSALEPRTLNEHGTGSAHPEGEQ